MVCQEAILKNELMFFRDRKIEKRCCGDFFIFIRTYKIKACGRAKKLNCFQIEMVHKIKLLIRLSRLPGSLDSCPESK